MTTNNELETTKAPIYLGGKSEKLWFIDDSWNQEREELDYRIFISLIAHGIGENICPTKAEWAELCISNAIIMAVTGDSLIAISKSVSLNDVEKYSWGKFWATFNDYNIYKGLKVLSLEFVEAFLRIFIPRNHYVGGPGKPYIESYFIKIWNGTFSHVPDCSNGTTCNVRLCYLKAGKKAFNILHNRIQKDIELVSGFIPPILKEVNYVIKG